MEKLSDHKTSATVESNSLDEADITSSVTHGVEQVNDLDWINDFDLSGLGDAEYLYTSQAFGKEYVGLLNGQINTEFQKQVSVEVDIEISPMIDQLESPDGRELSKYMVQGYRHSLNKLYEHHGLNTPFSDEEVSDKDLSHIVRIDRGPYGIPIIYTDGFNEDLFGDDTLSFASTELMLESGLPPVVVVYEGYNATEKEQVTIHETSHAVFTLLRRAGVIPNPEGEGITLAGKKSAFELARDEAIAQLAANQNGTGHPSVIHRMKSENYDDDAFEKYRNATDVFDRSTADRAGLNFSDAILGVMVAKNFTEFNNHMLRIAKIANEKELTSDTDATATLAQQDDIKSSWGSI